VGMAFGPGCWAADPSGNGIVAGSGSLRSRGWPEATEKRCCDQSYGPTGWIDCWNSVSSFESCCATKSSPCHGAFVQQRQRIFNASSSIIELDDGRVLAKHSWGGADSCEAIGGELHAVTASWVAVTESGGVPGRTKANSAVTINVCMPHGCRSDEDRLWVTGQMYGAMSPWIPHAESPRQLKVSVRHLPPAGRALIGAMQDAIPVLIAGLLHVMVLSVIHRCCSRWPSLSVLSLRCSWHGLMSTASAERLVGADAMRTVLVGLAILGHVALHAGWEGEQCGSMQAPALPEWHCSAFAAFRWICPAFMVLSGFLFGRAAAQRAGSTVQSAMKWLFGRMARAYVRQVSQLLVLLAVYGHIIGKLPLQADAAHIERLFGSLERARKFWFLDGLLLSVLPSQQSTGQLQRAFTTQWVLQVLMHAPLALLVAVLPRRRLWVSSAVALVVAVATSMNLPSALVGTTAPVLGGSPLQSSTELAPSAAFGFALGVFDTMPSAGNHWMRLVAGGLGAAIAALPVLYGLDDVSSGLGLSGLAPGYAASIASIANKWPLAPVAIFGLGFGLALRTVVACWSYGEISWSGQVITLLSRLSLGMMANSFPVFCLLDALCRRHVPLPSTAFAWISWSMIVWVTSAAAAIIQWCTLGSPSTSLLSFVVRSGAAISGDEQPPLPAKNSATMTSKVLEAKAPASANAEVPEVLTSTTAQRKAKGGRVGSVPRAALRDQEPWSLEQLPYQLPSYGAGPNHLYEFFVRDGKRMRQLGSKANVLVHKDAMAMMGRFLALMAREGTPHERRVYLTITPHELVLRLLSCRPLTFWLPQDRWLLKDQQHGEGGFEHIGTEDERAPLVIERLLSYDEMALSALVSVSSPTPIFNDGARDNKGRVGKAKLYPFDCVLTGVVGARFERERLMDHAHMVVTPQQNTEKNGYGRNAVGRRSELLRLWASFYGKTHFPDWKEAQQSCEYTKLPGCLFDGDVYKRRMRMSVEPFLLDADARACGRSKELNGRPVKAFVHVVGLGLGAWVLDERVQSDLMLEVYQKVMEEHELKNIGTVNFSYFSNACNQGLVSHPRIRIAFSRRNPGEPVAGDELLVAMYAWDGNAFPGNEFWDGHLDNSGDPAAACCSAIAVLQNPDANRRLRDLEAICVLPDSA